MENQDSEPLFGDDVYSLLRDDSLLHRTGSTNFAALIDSPDIAIPESSLNQQNQQHSHQEQQIKKEHQIKQEHQQQHLAQRVQQHNEETLHLQQQELKQEDGILVDNGGPSQSQQCIVYQIPANAHLREKVVLISPSLVANGQQSVQDQQQPQIFQLPFQPQQQPILSWDDIDMENDESTQSSSVNLINNKSFMAIVEETSSILPDTTSRVVPSLQPWTGRYNFNISLPVTDNRDRNKWCYSQEFQKLYVCPNVAIPLNITLLKWVDASITITPVFHQSQYRMDPVTRCYNCKNIPNCDPQLSDYVVHVEGEGCAYEIVQERPIVKVPLQPPPPGEEVSTLLVKLMCLTSCVGGPNRRPFCLVLTLRCNVTGDEIGRQILDVKCCKCPSRDKTNDARGVPPQTDAGKLTKVRRLSTQINVGQKKKKPNIKPEPGTETRYVNIAVPVEFELQVKSYVNGLVAQDILRRNQPSLLLYPEEDK